MKKQKVKNGGVKYSEKRCPYCNAPIKEKIAKESQSTGDCYGCRQVNKGIVTIERRYLNPMGEVVRKKTIDLVKRQTHRRRQYGWTDPRLTRKEVQYV